MSDDNVIQFPGAKPKPKLDPAPAPQPVGRSQALNPADLNEDQRKAIGIVLSGKAFVIVGIAPTQSGADFYTAVHGEKTDLRNAQAHLPDVIDRAFTRKGI